MFRTTISNLAARKLRLLSTGLAVILGVAFMAGTLVLTATIGRTFDALFTDVNAGVDAYVRSGEITGKGTMNEQRTRLDASIVARVAAVDGVRAAEPHVQGYAQVVGADGRPIGDPERGAPTLAGNWITTASLNPFTVAEGRPPALPGEAAIDKATAATAHLSLGDRATVLTPAGNADVTIVGISRFGRSDSPVGASYVHFDLATAEALLAAPGRIDAVRIAAGPGVSQDELVERVRRVVTSPTDVLTGAQITAEDQDSVAESLRFFDTFLLTFALIALFVGAFIVSNTFSILVAQRGRETALLRAIGASRRQVMASVLGEAAAVGLLASAVGVGAGIGVAGLLKALLGAMGVDIPSGGLVVTGGAVGVSMLMGLGITLVSAALPARRASKIAPIAALRGEASDAPAGRRRVVAGALLAAAGLAVLAAGLYGGAGIAPVGAGVAMVFVAVSVLGPTLARPITRAIGAPLPRLRGVAGGLARENAMRNPRRTSATAAALMVGVALVGTITVLASSAKSSIDHTISAGFTGDVVVEAGTAGFGGLDPRLAAAIAGLPQVRAATAVRTATVDIDGEAHELIAADPAALGGAVDLGHVEGRLTDLGAGQIGVQADATAEHHLAVGDQVTVSFADTGDRAMTVAVVYENGGLAGDYLIGLAAYEANVTHQLDTKIFVTGAPGVALSDLKANVAAAARDYPQAKVRDRKEFAAAAGGHIDQMLNLVYALLFLAILIALIGIANTLALSILERTRELGLLRAVGMSRRQLRSAIRWEAVLVALLGTVTGLAVGTGFGWALVRALRDQGIDRFVVPGGQLATVATLAAVAGVAAAILPARKAARLDILGAIAAD